MSADATFNPGYKFPTGKCLKKCANRDIKCDECYSFKYYKKTKKRKFDLSLKTFIEEN